MNYYDLLEISPSASVEVIRNAYKTLAKKYHPDTYRGDTSFAEEKMKLLNEAISQKNIIPTPTGATRASRKKK